MSDLLASCPAPETWAPQPPERPQGDGSTSCSSTAAPFPCGGRASALARPVVTARRRVLAIIAAAERSSDRWFTKILRPWFALFSIETQLKLARVAFDDMTVALIIADDRFGPRANVRVDGNTCQIGYVMESGDFAVLGRGRSWKAAFDDVDQRDEEGDEAPAS